MAAGVTAKFNADFSAFQKQVREGVKSVADLEKAAGASEGGVQRLQRAFSGERIIREARDTADAVAAIGGAAALTEKEQARVNATISEAIAKYKAMGIQAPADLVAIEKATASSTGVLGGLKSALNAVGLSMNAALGPAAIAATVVMAGKQFLDLTGKLTDLSGKTGISTTALQTLGFVTEQAGVQVEGVANAVTKMGKNLVEGNKSAVAGVEALGLGVDDLLKMSPDKAFITIGDAIAGVQNPMERATIATKIFGKSGAELLPAFTGDLAKLAKQAEDSGAILSEDMVAGGDAAGDAIGRLLKTGAGLIGQVLGPMMPLIEKVADLLGRVLGVVAQGVGKTFEWLSARFLEGKAKLLEFVAGILQAARDVPILGKHLGISGDLVDKLRSQAEAARKELQDFNENAAKPVSQTLQAAAPIIGDYSEKTERATKAKKEAKQAAVDLSGQVKNLTGLFSELAPSVESAADAINEVRDNIANGFAADGSLISRPINETAKATAAARAEAEEWARVNGAVLAPSITGLAGVVEESGTKAVSLFGGLMQGLPQSILSAIQGGGSVIGAAGTTIGNNLMANFTAKFGPAITAALPFGIGSAVTALLPSLGALFGPVAERIGGFFKNIFGGPSQEELRGRQAVADFERQLAGLLTQTQRNEAGNESWKMTVIAIRDAYIAMGRTEAEALADAERLWKSSKGAAGESARVIAEIEQKMKSQGETAKAAIDGVKDALDELPDRIDIPVNITTPEGDPTRAGEGYASGTKRKAGGWFANFGAGTATMLHGDEAVVPRGQVGDFVRDMGGSGSDALAAEVAGLRSDFAALPRMIARAVRDVVLVGA